MSKWPLGVFTSIDDGFGVHLDVADELDVPSIHLHSPHADNKNEQTAKEFLARCNEAGITITCVFCGFEGESYADIPTTARTIGLVPEESRAARLADARLTAEFARHLGCDTIGMHIGFVPHDTDSESYKNLVTVTQELLDHLAEHGQKMHLETGQETADHLMMFLQDVSRPNLFINFDPANMILYGTGDPIEALKKVGAYVKSCHCKDAVWAEESVRGKEWGREVALGEGDVDIPLYLKTLKEIAYDGPLTIERELSSDPVQQKADISKALELLKGIKTDLGKE